MDDMDGADQVFGADQIFAADQVFAVEAIKWNWKVRNYLLN